MKSLTKIALVSAALAASGGAYADVALPSAGVGQAVLFVKNETTGVVYARGISLTAEQVAAQGAITSDTYTGSGATPDTSLSFALPSSIGPDSNLTAFLGAGGTFSWGLMLGDSSGGLAVGDKRLISTSVNGITTPSNSAINTSLTQFNTFVGTLNAVLPDGSDNSSVSSGGLWDQAGAGPQAEGADIWFSAGLGVNNKVGLGDAAGFYLLTTSGGTTSAAGRQYLLGQLRLTANGTLESVSGSTPEVPLPPAVWLLGSALAGFAGLRRRLDGTAPA
jgi:hypothetical protein